MSSAKTEWSALAKDNARNFDFGYV